VFRAYVSAEPLASVLNELVYRLIADAGNDGDILPPPKTIHAGASLTDVRVLLVCC
jgi:hypothetical protein